MINRVRLPFYITQPQFPTTREVFTNSQGVTKVYSAVIRKTLQGKTDHLPKEWHEKLVIALNHKQVTIEGSNYVTGVAMDSDYEIDWDDFLDNPLAMANFTVSSTPFRAVSDNCMTCDEVGQLSLEDDFTDEVFEEGQEVQYPYPITQNDNICCYPFTLEVIDYNTDYLLDFQLDQNGVASLVLHPLAPILNNVWLATYRVTCESGQWDEAKIYGNISGSLIACIRPSNLQLTYDDQDPETVRYDWNLISPAPANGYQWALYLSDDLFTPVFSGTTTDNFVVINDVPPGTYTFAVRSSCGGGNYSLWTMLSGFSPRPINTDTCGNFNVTYIPSESEGMQTFSYIDCNGDVKSVVLAGAGVRNLCMLTDLSNVPIYFSASTQDINYTYIAPC